MTDRSLSSSELSRLARFLFLLRAIGSPEEREEVAERMGSEGSREAKGRAAREEDEERTESESTSSLTFFLLFFFLGCSGGGSTCSSVRCVPTGDVVLD